MIIPTLSRRLRARAVDVSGWRERPVSATDADVAAWREDRYTTTIDAHDLPGGPAIAFARGREALLMLRIFPSAWVALHVDAPNGHATHGATVVERVYLGPIGFEAAVRLVDVVDEHEGSRPRFALTWSTVEGHPERGVETFAIAAADDGTIDLAITARSRPAMTVVWLGFPVARWLQRRYSTAALARLAAAVRGAATRSPDLLRSSSRPDPAPDRR